jgi:Zn-finger nucleic acid-binding protein
MKCPKCEEELKEIPFQGIKVDSCSSCKGYWFEKDELRIAKDKKEEMLSFMDIDLWESDEKFRISKENLLCPECSLPLYEVNYGDSNVKIEVCNMCEGIWLDEGEFRKIIKYLKDEAGDKIMKEYLKTLAEETGEIFLGPDSLEDEVKDVLTVLSLLKYRFAGKHPFISETISKLPK